MTRHTRNLIAAAAVGVIGCAAGAACAADASRYPERPIRLIVPQAPGSSSDTLARIVALELTKHVGQQIVVDNRPGGALIIGMELIARAAPDGYTIGYAPIGALVISPNLVRKVPFDVRRDFQPIGQTAHGNMLLAASPAGPLKSVRDVIEYAKQNPGKLSNASSGNGTPGHVGFELFKTMTGTRIVHVPYKGGAAGIADLISGQVQLMLEGMNSITPHAKANRVRALAVSAAKRSNALPEVPTIAEAGVPGYEASTWNGIVGPAGMPRAIVVKLNAALNKALVSTTVRERLAAIGAEPTPVTPEQFGDLIRSEYVKWADVVKRSGARVD
ncbi:MAG: tripartite tricarboxylate transporter substrate binding protein [Betaproteobacteria bacterium]|nr:MAG: tripartite tricarboxylate transporter substrate binding protein [Betaproteobacteria bacterium]